MLYAHKRSLISVERIEEERVLITQSGNIPVKNGSLIAQDQLGNQYVVADEDFYTNYMPVRKMRKKSSTKQMSSFELEYAKGLMGFGSLPSQIEDEDYILGQMELTKNKSF